MSKYDGYGVVLEYDDAGNGTWVAIAQVRDVDGPELLTEAIEASCHSDDSNNHRDYVPGLNDLGDISFELAYDDSLASHTWLRSSARAAFKDFRVTHPDSGSTIWTFQAMVTSLSPKFPVDGLMTADVTLKAKGNITFS